MLLMSEFTVLKIRQENRSHRQESGSRAINQRREVMGDFDFDAKGVTYDNQKRNTDL